MRVFISYRREDASAWAGRLRDALAAQFGEENIFQDVATVRPGQKFTDAIEAALSRSDVALAVIGPRWLTAAGDDGEPRLAKSDDYVRAELLGGSGPHQARDPGARRRGDDARGRNASRGP